jgi:hypothetical protein
VQRLRGHFDGKTMVLDQAPPAELKPNTPVEIVMLSPREQALRELEAFLNALWIRPFASPGAAPGPHWRPSELYERGACLLRGDHP